MAADRKWDPLVLPSPPRAWGWAVAVLLVAVWGLLRLAVFHSFVFPLTYALPLLFCVWTRSRRMLWGMAGAFIAMQSVKQLFVLPADALAGPADSLSFAATVMNIVVAAFAVELVLVLRQRLEAAARLAEEKRAEAEASAAKVREQAAELTARNEELAQQGEELAQQTEELTQHGEELNRQSEELAAQNEELRFQAEEIQGLNTELGRREELLQALLEAARTSGGEGRVAERLCAAALELLGPPAAVAVVRERRGVELRLVGAAGVPQAAALPERARYEGTFAAVVIGEGRTASLGDCSLRPDVALLDLAGSRRFQSVLCSPVRLGEDEGETAVVEVYARVPHAWTEEQFRLLGWLALQGSQILQTLRLQRSMRRQAALINLSPDATIVKGADDRIRFWSGGAESLYGWSRHEVIGRTAQEVLHTRCCRDGEDMEREVRETGRWHGEVYQRTKDGRERIVESRWLGRGGPDGIEILESNNDITDRKRVEAALRRADEHKNRFLATLSHELRNPLAPIRYALELLPRGNREAEGTRAPGFEPREVIERQLAHLVRLVDDLLDVTRIASNKIRLQKGTVSLAGVVRQAVEAAAPAIDEAAHHLTVSLPPSEVWLDGDGERLAQVLINLLNNAARYTPKGGVITLQAHEDGSQVVLSVKDNGVGLRPEDVSSLFEMFTQVGEDTRPGGLGIGLALVKGVVELHGGRVEARSAGPGLGSEFVVRLPLSAAPPKAEPERPAAAAPTPRRVLVVDDNPDSAQMMKVVLELDGHDVRVAYDGPSALAWAAEFLPDVVLLDIGLPGMDGYEVARALRAGTATRGARLVAVTGWGQEEDRKRARLNGFDAHLTKPADPEEIRRLVAAAGAQPAV